MTTDDSGYRVGWRVYDNSILVLSKPYKNSKGVADYPKFNGVHWTEIGNVIVVYKIYDIQRLVSIHAAYSAATGFAMKRFYGEYDPLD